MSLPSSLLPVLLLLLTSLSQAANTVSIVSEAGYISQRGCSQNCVWHVGVDDDLIAYLGCSNNAGWQNSCYCRADLASSASYFLTSCVNKACSTNAVDLQAAVSAYRSYCDVAIGTATPVGNIATTTLGGPTSPVDTVLVVTTIISTSAATSLSSTLVTSPCEFFQLVTFALPLLVGISQIVILC